MTKAPTTKNAPAKGSNTSAKSAASRKREPQFNAKPLSKSKSALSKSELDLLGAGKAKAGKR